MMEKEGEESRDRKIESKVSTKQWHAELKG